MVLGAEPRAPAAPAGVDVRLVGPDDDLGAIGGVPAVAFANPGTAAGGVGLEAVREPAASRVASQREGLRTGRVVMAAAFVDGRAVASGVHVPEGDVTEVAGIGTLPAFRRRGIGAALTACLVADARARGIETIFLSAGDETIARVYASLGFARIGTSGAAEPV
jgi:ribosomal protein S18 acetylase RimI-like enzyme